MNIQLFNNNSMSNNPSHKDVLSVFRLDSDNSLIIQHGMSVNEISDVVSDRIIAIVKEQFKATKKEFEAELK